LTLNRMQLSAPSCRNDTSFVASDIITECQRHQKHSSAEAGARLDARLGRWPVGLELAQAKRSAFRLLQDRGITRKFEMLESRDLR
jgi:hypothetical protein